MGKIKKAIYKKLVCPIKCVYCKSISVKESPCFLQEEGFVREKEFKCRKCGRKWWEGKLWWEGTKQYG